MEQRAERLTLRSVKALDWGIRICFRNANGQVHYVDIVEPEHLDWINSESNNALSK